jgi:hypothetical protein
VDLDLDLDPVGSKTFSRIRMWKKSFRIWTAPGLKLIEVKKYSGKLIKFDNFSTKMFNLKIQTPFYKKNP